MKKTLITIVAFALCLPVFADNLGGFEAENAVEFKAEKKEKKKKEVVYNDKGEIIKTGLNFGPLPVVAYDADKGFQFGALLNIYNFGNGEKYPNYDSYWYFEASAYTGGSIRFDVKYDKLDIFPGVRLSANVGYYKDILDFYGFNGYQANYEPDHANLFYYTNPETKQGQKLQAKWDKLPENVKPYQKGFYRHDRQMVRAKFDFTGEIVKNFYWEAGYSFGWIDIDDFLPTKKYSISYGNSADDNAFDKDNSLSLFGLYKDWGIIKPLNAKKGAFDSNVRVGLMYDSRNVENNPTRGIWAEAHTILAPKWLGTTDPYYKVSATMRQYVPLGTEKVVFAYRLGYEGFLGKNTPWYMMPFYTNMGPKSDNDGYGGYRTVRGLMLNRVQAPHVGFYNIEVRYRFIDFKLWKQNIAFAISGFTDGISVFKGYDLTNKNEAQLAVEAPFKNDLYTKFIDTNKSLSAIHGSAGAGLRFIMNENFIVAFEYAHCFKKQDGKGAFYMNIGFLF